jgi:hypothetical protein
MEIGARVVVTTEYRGVFFGTLESYEDRVAVLTDARCCVFWSRETRGFLGLANTGPLGGSRVSPSVPEIELCGVTTVTLCGDAAAEQWETGPWQE